MKPFGVEYVDQTFVEEFGKSPVKSLISSIPEAISHCVDWPGACGNAARAQVAVKVQRPEVMKEFGGDIGLMSATVRLVQIPGLRWLRWMVEPMSEFIAWTREELDFRNEARYMEQLRSHADGSSTEYVPEVEWDYTSARTLVMEFLEGVTLLDSMRAIEQHDTKVLKAERMHFEANNALAI